MDRLKNEKNIYFTRDKEKEREKYIITQGNKIIRYNPNTSDFDLSNVLKQINKIVFQKTDK